jgi:hypothetical protein
MVDAGTKIIVVVRAITTSPEPDRIVSEFKNEMITFFDRVQSNRTATAKTIKFYLSYQRKLKKL